MRRFYNKGAKGLSGGQVKLDKMGNNDGKISGEDFAVMRSRKMGGGMMEEAKEINSKIKNSRTLKMGGGMMKRPMYKDGSPKTKQEKNFKITKNNIGKIKEAIKKGRSEAFKSNVKPFKEGGRVGLKAGSGKDTHVTKDGRTVKKGLYYYMNRAKKKGTSKPGKGTVTDKALKASAKTAKKPTKKA